MVKPSPNSYFRVRKEGNTRVISLGKVLPEGWEMVKIEQVASPYANETAQDVIYLKLTKVS